MAIGFIGAGNISGALIRGILKSRPNQIICAADTNVDKLKILSTLGVTACNDNLEVVSNSDIVVLAVKPNMYPTVLQEIASLPQEVLSQRVLVSVAPGMSTSFIAGFFSCPIKIVRTMPNMPVQVNAGMTTLCFSPPVTEQEFESVKYIFDCVGKTCVLQEQYMDCTVALNGSSPVYTYMMIEAMADTAVKYGLDYNTAYTLAAQSIMGAAKMVLDTNVHPAKLRNDVCSPGGTTIEAVLKLDSGGFKSAIESAMRHCTRKAIKLAKK